MNVAVADVDAAFDATLAGRKFRRFANRPLSDTVFRLARDPLRKLGPNDRLVGAARLAEKAGVAPEGLSWSIAGGLGLSIVGKRERDASIKIDVKPMITDTFAFKDSIEALDFATRMPPTSIKVQVELPQ